MRCSYLRLFAISAFAGALLLSKAQAAPVYLLPLTCSSEAAIGRPQNECHGTWTYEEPTSERLIVFRGPPYYFWDRAENLASSDLVQVCFLPVEPGTYSSCRSATTGQRATGFQLKGLLFRRDNVIVSKSGGDYSDPVAAAQNAFAGDTWCVAPQPDRPCVMAIGEGVFILRETLQFSGLSVAGAGKGATILVADNGVETAVAGGNARVSGVTIVNSQPGAAQTIGFLASGSSMHIEDTAIHVSGAARNVGIGKRHMNLLEMLDSEITAIGRDSTGIETLIPDEPNAVMTVERSVVSAEHTAIDETETDIGPTVRLIDSCIAGHIVYGTERTLLDIVRTAVVGDISAHNDLVNVRLTGSYIKGVVGVMGLAGHDLDISGTTIEGAVHADHASGTFTFDGLRLLGELRFGEATRAEILRSYISSSSNLAALSLGGRSVGVELEQTFVGGALAVAADAGTRLQSVSSVLAGPVSASGTAELSCMDTYGADYELLTPSCQPQPP